MASKHVKRCSISYVIGELQIKPRYHYSLLEWPKFKTLDSKMLVRMWNNRNSYSCWWECKMIVTVEDSVTVSYKTNHTSAIQPSCVLLSIYPKGSWKLMSTHKPAHDAYGSLIHNCQNLEVTKISFRRPIDKLCYIQTMEYYLAPKRNELLSHEKT